MKIAMTLDGTDAGRSGLGTWVRGVLPALSARLRSRGDELIAFGRSVDFEAYSEALGDASRVALPDICRTVSGSAAFHLLGFSSMAARCGADVMLLPAANRRATALSSIPSVAVVHDLAQLHVEGKYDWVRMTYVREVLLRTLGAVTELVVPSHATRADVATALRREDRLRVVPNGVDLRRFDTEMAPAAIVRTQAALGLAYPYILYVSRLEHPGKNHVRLVEAFARSKVSETHQLLFAGDDWGARSAIEAEIARCSMGSRIRLLGRVADEHLLGLTAGADVATMAGLCEGFGLPALEALACGVSVAVSDKGALPEVVGDLGALFDPYDVRSMAAALDRAAHDRELRRRVRDHGPTTAKSLNWDRTAEGLLAACDAALS